MRAKEIIEKTWFTVPVTVQLPGKRTAMGETPGEKVQVLASVNATATKVLATNGTEVVASATLAWSEKDILPPTGATITLPPEFGIKGAREVLAATRAYGNEFTPNHIQVSVK